MPTARAHVSAVDVAGKLYVIGGSTATNAHGSTLVNVYDPASDEWSTALPVTVGRSAAAVLSIGGSVYVIGGFGPGATMVATNRVDLLNTINTRTVAVTQAGATPTYAVAPAAVTFPATASTAAVTLTATPVDAPWTAESNQPWLSVSNASGLGTKTLTLSVLAYTTSVLPRTATISIKRDAVVVRTVAVTQTALLPTFTLAPTTWSVGADGGTQVATLGTTPPDAPWTGNSTQPWVTLSATSGSGPAAITLTAAPYTTSTLPRTATVTIGGKTLLVRQAGATAVLTLTPPLWNVGAAGGTQPVTLTAVPNTAAWAAQSSAPWLVTNKPSGIGGTAMTLTAQPHTTSVNPRVASLRVGSIWQALTAMPTARGQAGAGAINGLVYVAGGFAGGVHQSVLQVYNPVTNTWTNLVVAGNQVQTAPASAVALGKLYLAGGATAGGPVATTRAYDPVANSWTLLPDLPTPRAQVAGGVIANVFYVVGGTETGGLVSSLNQAYDIANNTWSPRAPLPEARTALAAAVLGDTLYVIGGANGAGAMQATLYAYDPIADAWQTRAAMPTARGHLAAQAIDGKLVVVGGSTPGPVHGSAVVEVYDPATDTWSPGTPLPAGRSASATVFVNGTLYVLGGFGPGATFVATNVAYGLPYIADQTVRVTQAGATPTYAVAPAAVTLPTTASTASVTLTATPTDAPWTTESNQPWLSVAPASGLGTKTLTLSVLAYTTSVLPRTATISIKHDGVVVRTVAVTQTALLPTFTLAPATWSVGAAGGTQVATLGTTPPDAPWTATSTQPWVTFSATSGSGPAAITLTAAPYTTSTLPRTATVTIGGKTLLVRQAGATAVLTLTPPLWNVGAAGGTQPVTLTAVPNTAAWAAQSSAPWLVTNKPSGIGGTAMTLTAQPHTTSVNPRVASLRVGSIWQALTAMPTARGQAGAGAINGLVYVAGGFAGGVHQSVLQVYNPVTNTWTNLVVAGNQVQTAPASAVALGKLYLAGGATAGGPVATTRAYDPVANSWTLLADLPTPRAQVAGGVIANVFYVVGGTETGGLVSSLNQAYDIANNTWSLKAPLPEARTALAAAVLGDTLYVIGGANGAGAMQATLYAYDPIANAWQTRAAMPTARGHLAAQAIDGKLVVVGGSTPGPVHGSAVVEVYDPATDTWSPGTPLPAGRSAAATVFVNGTLYVLGGFGPGPTFVATNVAYGLPYIADQTVRVTQAGATPTYSVAPVAVTFQPAGGTAPVTLTATPTDAPWTATSSEGWLTVSQPDGAGSKALTLTATPWTQVETRTATVTIGGKIVAVAQRGTGSALTGTVKSAAGVPLQHVFVDVYDAATGRYVATATTNAIGGYVMTVPPGSYLVLTANAQRFIDQLVRAGGNAACMLQACTAPGTPVVLAAGATVTMNFTLAPGGAITGSVRNSVTNAPIAGVGIQVVNAAGEPVAQTVTTNASGVYLTSTGLVTGTYYVRTHIEAGPYVNEVYDNVGCFGFDCPLTSATGVAVTAGVTKPGINFLLDEGAQFSGTVTAAGTGDPLPTVTLSWTDRRWKRRGRGGDVHR